LRVRRWPEIVSGDESRNTILCKFQRGDFFTSVEFACSGAVEQVFVLNRH